jgi:hypothetical protein
MRLRELAAAVAAAGLVLSALPASAQTAPSPAPSPTSAGILRSGQLIGGYTASASTDQTTGSVDYTAQDGSRLTSSGVHSGGGRSCIGEAPQQAGATYGGGSGGSGMDTFVPAVGGKTLPMVGGFPASLTDPGQYINYEYIVVCNGVPTGFGIWDPGPAAPAATPQEIAQQVSGQIPMPNVTVEINPPVGLAGLQAWFWVTGYAGAPVVEMPPALGHTLTIVATPTSYTWSFGDGSAPVVTTDLGQPYPRQSDITHTYQAMTTGTDYQVRVTFSFAVSYRVDGGAWIALPAIQRTASASYQVGEAETIIVQRG